MSLTSLEQFWVVLGSFLDSGRPPGVQGHDRPRVWYERLKLNDEREVRETRLVWPGK